MGEVSIFKNIRQKKGGVDAPFSSVMDWIKNGDYKKEVEFVQSVPDSDEAAKRKAKEQVPYFTASGTFDYVKKDNLKKHSGRIILDLDHVKDIEFVKEELSRDQYTEYCFISVSGGGLAVVVKIDPNNHSDAFKDCAEYYNNKYNPQRWTEDGKPFDTALKDVSRARFMSYDPNIYSNPNSKVFQVLTKEVDRIKTTTEKMIQGSVDGEKHNVLIKASKLMGGYIAGGVIEETEAKEHLKRCISLKSGVADVEAAFKDIEDGIEHGKSSPITIEKYRKDLKSKEEFKKKMAKIFGHAMSHLREGHKLTEISNHIDAIAKENSLNIDVVASKFKEVYDKFPEEFNLNKKPKIDQVENFLSKNWDFIYNEVTQITQCREKKTKKWEDVNTNSLHRSLQKVGLKYPLTELKSLMYSDFVETYNPFVQYFNNLEQYQGKHDFISELASYVKTSDDKFWKIQFKKALVRSIHCSLDNGVNNNKVNRIVMVLVGEKQETGKSTFIRFLSPFGQDYYTESPLKDGKDSSFALSENFIYNLEELDELSKFQTGKLKRIISAYNVKERKPWDRDAKSNPRRCNFWGSTNKTDFLTDNENTRWLCFKVDSIKWGYEKKINIHDVWAQAYSLYKDNKFEYNLTKSEKSHRDDVNKDFEFEGLEKQLLIKYFQVPDNNAPGESEFMSSSDILTYLSDLSDNKVKISHNSIGKYMSQLGYKSARLTMNKQKVRGFYVKKQLGNYNNNENKF
jgi:hypothetical protein